MANDEHVALLKQGVTAWNAWRDENPSIRPNLSMSDLSGADLMQAHLSGADLSMSDLSGANLMQADLRGADLSLSNLSGADLKGAGLREARLWGTNLSGANLSGATLWRAFLTGANLSGAHLRETDLRAANLSGANLMQADLRGADLKVATLVDTDLTLADLTGCRIHGVSAWDLKLGGAKQQNLVITPEDAPEITVDNIEVAQFIYLMLNNQKVREVIDTITSKAVLILGRFTDERKVVLDALREELRKRNYLPILFDFEQPRSRDTVETITLLARMAKFVIADVTDAKAVLQELQAIVPSLPSLPVQPIILRKEVVPFMFDHFRNMKWFLKVHRYDDQGQLLADLGDKVISPAEKKALKLQGFSGRRKISVGANIV